MSGVLPLRKVKGGAGEKEPAYLILRRHFVRIAAIVALGFAAGALLYVRQSGALEDTVYQWQEKARSARFFQHRTHAQYAMLGQELEQHLTRDARESVLAERIVERIGVLEAEFNANLTRAVEATLKHATAAGALVATGPVEAQLRGAVHAASGHLFTRMNGLIKARRVPLL